MHETVTGQPRRPSCSNTKPCTEGEAFHSRYATVFRGEAAVADDCTAKALRHPTSDLGALLPRRDYHSVRRFRDDGQSESDV